MESRRETGLKHICVQHVIAVTGRTVTWAKGFHFPRPPGIMRNSIFEAHTCLAPTRPPHPQCLLLFPHLFIYLFSFFSLLFPFTFDRVLAPTSEIEKSTRARARPDRRGSDFAVSLCEMYPFRFLRLMDSLRPKSGFRGFGSECVSWSTLESDLICETVAFKLYFFVFNFYSI